MDRFWSKVDKSGQCWEWIASRFHDGYGQFRLNGRPRRAHRVAYELVVGPIPEGLVIDHLCRNRACVNPDHLEPVTEKVNINRGVSALANALRGARLTHCTNGHPFTPENTYRAPRGHRECKTCRREAGRRYRNKRIGSAA